MLSGLQFIPRDQIDSARDEKLNDSDYRKKKKKPDNGSSSDDGLERIKKRSRKKKWSSSEEDPSSYSDDSESDKDSEQNTRISRKRKEEKNRRNRRLEDEEKGKSKKSRRRKEYSTDDDSGGEDRISKSGKKDGRKKGKGRLAKDFEDVVEGDGGESHSLNDKNIARKEMGLEWMLRPKDDVGQKSASTPDLPEEPTAKEVNKVNPRELNPYLKIDGSGYPEEADGVTSAGSHLLSTSVVGDGGASWRFKALKRAQEQAAREGKKLEEVVGERWGSLGELAVSVASRPAAPSHAHLHAIKNRVRQQTQDQQMVRGDQDDNETDSQKVVSSSQHAKMRVPRVHDSLSWGKRKSQSMSVKDAGVISSALTSLNKFSNDGSFLRGFKSQRVDDSGPSVDSYTDGEIKVMSDMANSEEQSGKADAYIKPKLSANQLAARVMQLRMKGKHEEAEKLLKEAENYEEKSNAGSGRDNTQGDSRHIIQGVTMGKKKKEENADFHLAHSIMQNKQYTISGQADDEYDYDEGPKRKKRSKGGNNPKPTGTTHFAKRILTQQERCNFCFENPSRPKHLVVAIANFTYLMLPPWQPLVPGHCCILPMQHESATRSVDNNVWDEIRNFKKCLLMMFAKQDKDVIFLETVMELAKQRRHCLVECIPLPQEIAKQGPLYFKKAIDEAEEEWSQHNAKKLIDTSEKGLRSSIPKDFPYFHVEFGLKKGFVHVIDDESQFKSNFGLNVIRGMLRLPAEDMHRRQKHDSVEAQKQAVASFARDWEPFDWTKQLD